MVSRDLQCFPVVVTFPWLLSVFFSSKHSFRGPGAAKICARCYRDLNAASATDTSQNDNGTETALPANERRRHTGATISERHQSSTARLL